MASAASLDPTSVVDTQQTMKRASHDHQPFTERLSSEEQESCHRGLHDMEEEAEHPGTFVEKSAPQDQGKLPPNGGLFAWLQVAASFCIFFSTW